MILKYLEFYSFMLILLSFLARKSSASEDSILVLTPHIWIGEFDQTILVDRLNTDHLNSGGKLNINIVNSNDPNLNYTLDQSISSNLQLIRFKLPIKFPSGSYNLTVTATGQKNYVFRNYTKDIQYIKNADGYYIITDKPVYKPSETVNIRIVGINGLMNSINNKTMSLFITDPLSNLISQQSNLVFSSGLIDNLSFKLSSKALTGEWKIKIIVDNEERIQQFLVKEYVLPKFDFTLDAPNYLIKSRNAYEGSLEAKYNYGKYVEGDVLIRVISRDSYYLFNQKSIASPSFFPEKIIISKSYKLSNQNLKFSLPISKNLLQNYYSLVLNVTVTDSLSGESSSKEIYIGLHDNEFNANMNGYNYYQFESDKMNRFEVLLTYHDGKPYALKNVQLNLYSYIGFDPNPSSSIRTQTKTFSNQTDMNGIIELYYYVPKNTTSLIIEVILMSDKNQKVSLYLSPKMTIQTSEVDKLFSIELANKNQTLKINSNVGIKIKLINPNGTCYSANYIIISRVIIENFGTFELCNERDLEISLNRFNAPFTNLIVYTFDDRKNLYVENFELSASNIYLNYLNISFENEIAEPGQNVSLNIQSQPGSLVAICVYDQSLDLIRPSNDLKTDHINEFLYKQKLTPYYQQPDYSPFMMARPDNFYQSFEKNKAELTLQPKNLLSYKDYTNGFLAIEDGGFGNRPIAEAAMNDQTNKEPSSKQTEKIRSDFRESWIWQTVQIGPNGTQNLTTNIPETITKWVATGFSLNNQTGLAIADKTNITTFQNFFISIVSPKFLVRGEILILQVIVYNYFNVDLNNVTVTLSKTSDFKKVVLKNNGRLNQFFDINNDLETVIPLIKSQTGQTTTFLIMPVKVGSLALTVKARSAIAADAERKNVLVKAEGVEDFNTIPLLIDLRETKKYETKYQITLPPNIISNSQYCSVQVIGDMLGPAFNNLENLVTKPYGCGEQNMITLTPNIYALKYLLATLSNKKSKINNLEILIQNSKNNIQFGYQNQLNYLRSDGSFSAFGNQDKSGSTWLTAFVIRSFSQAREFATIDENIIKNAVNWLIRQQSRDGSYIESGNVIHSDMQGGVNSKITITAYVIISLVSSNLNDYMTNTSISKGLRFLENSLSSKSLDTYALGLINYALNIGKSSLADTAFKRFDALANRKTNDQIYWPTSNESTAGSANLPNFKRYNDVLSSDVEITSYGLLTYLLRKKQDSSLLIVKWLISKSNSLGTYSSTQNTILALESLAEFGIGLISNASNPLNVSINVKLENLNSKTTLTNTFNINDENSLILQTWEINNCNSTIISINATGNGIVSFKTSVNYNLPNVIDNTTAISVTQSVVTKDFKNKNVIPIRTCAKYTNPKKTGPKSGMFIIESELFGGFETNIDKSKIKNNLKLVEINPNNKVSFYFDYLNETLTCIDWQMIRTYPVSNLKPVTVAAYDYYNPIVQKRIIFNSPSDFSSANICKTNADLKDCK